jgi:hypothetical protein
VFLSCSEKFKLQVARPIRDALAAHGVFAVIVSDEPMLPWVPSDPGNKVEAYLNAADAFVALSTPDNHLKGGAVECRQNIIDEIRWAMTKPHLRSRIQVFKEATVELPSNLGITHEPLDVDDIGPVAAMIVRQLRAWDVIGSEPERAPTPSAEAPLSVREVIDGLALGDHEEAARRSYRLLRTEPREAQEAMVEALRRFIRRATSAEGTTLLRAASILEALDRLDPSLVSVPLIAEMAESDDFQTRSSAAVLLWQRAEVAPAEVPLGLLGRLALPSTEDWYVQAPAMAAVKLLMLRRRSARAILDDLASSANPNDRYAVALALVDLARVDRWAAPRDLAEALSRDSDELVAAKANEAVIAIGPRREREVDPLSPFGM